MNTTRPADRKIIAFLLSCIMHLLILLLLVQTYAPDKKKSAPESQNLQQPPPPQSQQEEEWVATHKNPPSDPVLFLKDEPEPPVPTPDAPPPQEQPEPMAQADQSNNEQLPDTPQEIVPEPHEVAAQLLRSAQRTKQNGKKKDTLIHKRPAPQQAAQQPDAAMQPPVRPQVALADIAREFMRVAAEEQAVTTMQGKQSGHASAEQLNRGRYFQKILECLVSSYHSIRKRDPEMHGHNPAEVRLAVSRKGGLAHLEISRSYGNVAVDQFLLSLFKDASTAFPPVPESLAQDHYFLSLVISDIRGLSSASGWMLRQN